MPRRSRNEIVRCRYFRWVLRRRGDVFVADGRANRPDVGRHSLGAKNHDVALERLRELDLVQAIEHGLADRSALVQSDRVKLELRRGWELHCEHLARPEVVGGASPKAQQRYQPVADKFIAWAEADGLHYWNDVTARHLSAYLRYLEGKKYAPRTLYMEATVLRQTMKWLASERQIPQECLFKLPLKKVRGTNTYCWSGDEVTAMIEHCRCKPQLHWLGDVIVGLAHTGMRISELAGLLWSDIDLGRNVIHLSNDPPNATAASRDRRRTKNRRDRTIPVHSELRTVLERMHHHIDGRVFHGARAGKIKPDRVRVILIRDVIEPLKQRFPTPPGERGFEHGRVHSFRHYFCSAVANAGVPVIVYVSPSGGRAASAGTFVTAAGHIAAMAPGTNIGAASPISGQGEELPETLKEKIFEDTAAEIRSIAERRGRAIEPLEATVLEAKSYTNNEALELGIIDLVASSVGELLDATFAVCSELWRNEGMNASADVITPEQVSFVGFADELLQP